MEWNDDFVKNLEKQLGDNLERAAIHLKGKVKDKLNRSQPYKRYVGEEGIYYHGENPSTPGEAPKKITGILQRSITHQMSQDRMQAFVGSNMPEAFWLETGTAKMAARPFLRSTMLEEADALTNIVAGGTK